MICVFMEIVEQVLKTARGPIQFIVSGDGASC
jgi:hypothetical protein